MTTMLESNATFAETTCPFTEFPDFLHTVKTRHTPLVARFDRTWCMTNWAGNAKIYGYDFKQTTSKNIDCRDIFPFLYAWSGAEALTLAFFETPNGLIAEIHVQPFNHENQAELRFYNVHNYYLQLQHQQQRGHELEILRYRHHQILDKLKQEQTEIQRLHQAQNELMARLAHEFRAPLVTMQYWTQHWQKDSHARAQDSLYDLRTRQAESTNVLTRNISHLLELVENLLTQGQQSHRPRQLKPEWLSVDGLLESLHGLLHARALKNGHELCFMVADNVGDEIWADGLALRQVLLNILSNAIQYARPGKIELRIRYQANLATHIPPRYLEFQIIDSGDGISEALEKNLFQAFRRGENNQNTGSGLGLSISQQLAEQMQGKLFLRQARPFCEFVLRLPTQNRLMALENKRLLIIEDDTDIAALMQWVFGDLGLETVHAITLDAAESILLTEKFDAILLDGQLPDGLATDWLARQNQSHFAHLPVLVVSAVRDAEFIATIEAHSNAQFVPKGLAWEEILGELVNLMEKCGVNL